MSEEEKVETTPEVEAPQVVAETVEQPETEEFDAERAMATIQKLREIEKKAKRDAKRLAELEQAEETRKRAEMSEIERLQAENEAIKSKYQQAERENQQRSIAAEVGLPDAFALRIQGNDAEEMRADAEALLKAMPAKPPARVSTTNPAQGTQGETDAEKRRRLLG
jgi:multidrug efflux pump subunit AcrB